MIGPLGGGGVQILGREISCLGKSTLGIILSEISGQYSARVSSLGTEIFLLFLRNAQFYQGMDYF